MRVRGGGWRYDAPVWSCVLLNVRDLQKIENNDMSKGIDQPTRIHPPVVTRSTLTCVALFEFAEFEINVSLNSQDRVRVSVCECVSV